MQNLYEFEESEQIASPALLYYAELLHENLRRVLSMAGGPERLWPHVKTHKMAEMVKLQLKAGITKFKCATIAEAEMAAACGASDVMLAYPLVGPSISRFLKLCKGWPSVRFWAIADNLLAAKLLGEASLTAGQNTRLLADVNLGMDRTGITPEQLEEFYCGCGALPGISLEGLHCYDGNRTEKSIGDRRQAVNQTSARLRAVLEAIAQQGLRCDTLVMGGTPSFPCYLDFPNAYFSPGTLFVHDSGYLKKYPDLDFIPAAAVLTRVVSLPRPGHFTLDLGYKGISSDPPGLRGTIVGLEHIEECFQSEEHWAFRMEPGYEDQCPVLGQKLFVIPTHICPTTALYPYGLLVENGRVSGRWEITARNREITC